MARGMDCRESQRRAGPTGGGVPRREFLAAAAAAMAGAVGACNSPAAPGDEPARLTARPSLPSRLPTIGFSPLGLRNSFTGRDGLLYVPASYRSEAPAPLLILFHGGGGRSSRDWNSPDLAALADSIGAVVLAPDSRSFGSWDIIESANYDSDVPFLDQALRHTFDQCRIDPARVAVGGFSDGAGMALSIGLANGDFTRAVLAFSPGFLDDRYLRGTPRFFVSHGDADPVLSFESTRDILVPFLRSRNLAVQWEPFPGSHEIPEAVGNHAFEWLAAGWWRSAGNRSAGLAASGGVG